MLFKLVLLTCFDTAVVIRLVNLIAVVVAVVIQSLSMLQLLSQSAQPLRFKEVTLLVLQSWVLCTVILAIIVAVIPTEVEHSSY